ncbi:MAG TPA: SDR family oxidoreductase [Allosphingosinicella sp.]|nr:SDR family oxidoreductase [Allosphingosinicella sp.]
MSRLAGKVAIVTGAATGIGRETALLYAEQGAKVALSDLRAAEGEEAAHAIAAAGGEAIFVPADVATSADLAQLVARTERHFGRLDILTANAGVLGRNPWTPLHETRREDFEQVIAVNLYGVADAFKYAIPALLRAGGGALTATTSLGAHRGVKGLDAYSASKAAVTGLVRSLTAQYSPGIRINAVSPGAVATELAAHTAELNDGKVAWPDRSSVAVAGARDIAYAHLFLASDEAAFVMGQVLKVDGGRSILDIA